MSISLFRQLRNKFHRAEAISRRRLLQTSAVAGASLFLTHRLSGAARPVGKRVVVIGAGLAGLSAAEQLASAGYQVTVVEARPRIGGRVLSFQDFVPNRTVEGGAELIGSNHLAWIAYAQQFNLSLIEMTESDLEAPIVLEGMRLSPSESAQLWEDLELVLSRLNIDAENVDAIRPWESDDAKELDSRSLGSWIDSQLDVNGLTRKAMHAQLSGDNGVDSTWQSYLANLAMIRGGGLADFWTQSETHRCAGGNQQLATKLAETLGQDRIRLGIPVKKIQYGAQPASVTLADGERIECDDILLTVPPSVWNRIDFQPSLPAHLRPQMGSNVKYLAHVRNRFWNSQKLSQYSLGDGPVSMTWESTDNQPEGEACLVAFSGGQASEQCRRWSDAERDANYLLELEKFYAGSQQAFIRSRFMDWPSDPWAAASYSFPAPGQITLFGPLLQSGLAGSLHFAGEYTCWAFMGYMEGALQSGLSIARRLAQRDGITGPR